MRDEVFAEPIRAHRYWWLNTEKMQLAGMNGYPWDTGFLEAVCANHPHQSPHWPTQRSGDLAILMVSMALAGTTAEHDCMCGVNAYKLTTPVEHTPSGDGSLLVHGLVDLGGRVHEYERGYRAQYGLMVEAMILTNVPYGSNFTGYLAEKYECPFKVMTPADWKIEWEATYGRDRETSEEDQDTEAAPRAFTFTSGSHSISIGGSGAAAGANTGQSASYQAALKSYQDAMIKAMYSPISFNFGGSFDDVEDLLKRRSVGDWIADNALQIWLWFRVIVMTLVAVLAVLL